MAWNTGVELAPLAGVYNIDNMPADMIDNTTQQVTTTLTATSNTTLANVVGLSWTLTAGGVYCFDASLTITAGASGGIKFAHGGTATATNYQAQGLLFTTTTVSANSAQTTLGSTFGNATAAATFARHSGIITVNAGGTFTLQAAQNASNGTATTIAANTSWMRVWRVA